MRKRISAGKSVSLCLALLFIIIAFTKTKDVVQGSGVSYQNDSILYKINTTRESVKHLIQVYGNDYKGGVVYLEKLSALENRYIATNKDNKESIENTFKEVIELQKKAILSSPVIDFDEILLVRRKLNVENFIRMGLGEKSIQFGFPTNHTCNSSLRKTGWENEVAILTDFSGEAILKTFLASDDKGYIGEIDLHWDADKMLYTKSDAENWKVMEMDFASVRIRQVSQTPVDIDCFDATYLPNGKIVFGSTANYQSVPCWHGLRKVSNLYLMNNDGSEMRRLCYDQDHDHHPVVISSGQVLFNRWDYTGINYIFNRQQMVMNPDGTGQRAIYGSNSWFPNALYFSKEIPGKPGKLISILGGYHSPGKVGQLVVIDTRKGWHEADGIIARISGRGDKVTPKVRDLLIDGDWPKFTTPYPINDKYFLVAGWKEFNATSVGIYLADIFDNLILLKEIPGYALLEPVPLRTKEKPPVIPDRVKPDEEFATVFIHNVYEGPGLQGVPQGTIKNIRVIAYHFGYIGMAGSDKIGYGGPWEVMQIIGTTPVEQDGSAIFKVPANMPIAFQPLDDEGRAVQLMRSWVTAMPGEFMSCLGCHESPSQAASLRMPIASHKQPSKLDNWYGPPRGFDFEREVQPVLDRYCIECHNGNTKGLHDLRAKHFFPDYKGKKVTNMEIRRLHPVMLAETNGYFKYSPAYDALIPYIRRVGLEDDVSLLLPGHYHAGTSPLIQLLKKGHHNVELSNEAWERLYTWIDLNGPCHGTWNEVFPIQDGIAERRLELNIKYGGPTVDPEAIPEESHAFTGKAPYQRKAIGKPSPLSLDGWPLSQKESRDAQAGLGETEKVISLGNGLAIKLVKIPPGSYILGNPGGQPDEPQKVVNIKEAFWMSSFEISNAIYRLYDPSHDSRYYSARRYTNDDQGLSLNEDNQPVVRVSWKEAMEFCQWLSDKTGMKFSLPTEEQFEYACRAGSATDLFFGNVKDDFTPFANLADKSFGPFYFTTIGIGYLIPEGAYLADITRQDNYVVTSPVGTFQPNIWGLYDMHGNAAEWVKNAYTVPGSTTSGNDLKVVRGGSFFDHPSRAQSACRLAYPEWQRVFNVGFRVVAEIN